MKASSIGLLLGLVAAAYVLAVRVFGFSGPVALAVHFARVSVVMAVLVLYAPAVWGISKEYPLRGRAYLLIGIVLMSLSNELFSIGNEIGRILDINMSIFTNPVAGFFSLMTGTACAFVLVPSEIGSRRAKIMAMACGVVFSIILVLVAPRFR